jgi:hypothetical protein
MPILGIYAAAAWQTRGSLLRQWRQPAFWLATTVCGVLALSWCRELMIDLPHLFSFLTPGPLL